MYQILKGNGSNHMVKESGLASTFLPPSLYHEKGGSQESIYGYLLSES